MVPTWQGEITPLPARFIGIKCPLSWNNIDPKVVRRWPKVHVHAIFTAGSSSRSATGPGPIFLYYSRYEEGFICKTAPCDVTGRRHSVAFAQGSDELPSLFISIPYAELGSYQPLIERARFLGRLILLKSRDSYAFNSIKAGIYTTQLLLGRRG